ncbi:hypothetical protein MPER_10886 [Moniliophthora perniciosa FA553]|nr:hypothetical protein MPER_10886 [Moniliophthora perniciosa FA553]
METQRWLQQRRIQSLEQLVSFNFKSMDASRARRLLKHVLELRRALSAYVDGGLQLEHPFFTPGTRFADVEVGNLGGMRRVDEHLRDFLWVNGVEKLRALEWLSNDDFTLPGSRDAEWTCVLADRFREVVKDHLDSDVKPNPSIQNVPSDLHLFKFEHRIGLADFPFPEKMDIASWCTKHGVPDKVMQSLKEFGIADTDDLQGLSLKDPSRPFHNYGIRLGDFLVLRAAAVKWLKDPLRPCNPFFTLVSHEPEVVLPPEDCHGFLRMPIEYLLYHPSEKKVLQKLQDHHIHDASLLNYLSRDHIHIIGLTEYDCFRLEKVAERDA